MSLISFTADMNSKFGFNEVKNKGWTLLVPEEEIKAIGQDKKNDKNRENTEAVPDTEVKFTEVPTHVSTEQLTVDSMGNVYDKYDPLLKFQACAEKPSNVSVSTAINAAAAAKPNPPPIAKSSTLQDIKKPSVVKISDFSTISEIELPTSEETSNASEKAITVVQDLEISVEFIAAIKAAVPEIDAGPVSNGPGAAVAHENQVKIDDFIDKIHDNAAVMVWLSGKIIDADDFVAMKPLFEDVKRLAKSTLDAAARAKSNRQSHGV